MAGDAADIDGDGASVSFVTVEVAGLPAFPSVSVRVMERVSVPSPSPERSSPVICWGSALTVPVPVTGVPPPELAMEKL